MGEIKILIVEDDFLTALDLKETLQELQYTVTGIAKKEKEIIQNIKDNRVHIILMDIELNQKKNGIDIANEIYKIKAIPIIFISGIDNELVIDEAINFTPANYLTKPFNKIQLKTAIELVVNKHYTNSQNTKQHIGCNYFFDTKYKKLFHNDKIVNLSLNEKKFLILLIEAKGEIVYFEEIEAIVWHDLPVSNDAIRNLIYRLRKKIDCDIIETITSHGYRLKNSK